MLDFPQPTCVHVENEASNWYILGNPWMRPDLLDLRPSVLLRVLEGKQAHRNRCGVTRLSGDLVVQLLVSEGCEPAAGVIEEHLFPCYPGPAWKPRVLRARRR